MTRSFGLNATSALEALRAAVNKFRDDDLNEDLARECACKAWRLCDHVSQALGSNSPFASLRGLQDHTKRACPELAYLQDICIESKHAGITRNTPRIKGARHHGGAFSRGFSKGFDTSRLEIELLDGRTVFFDDVVSRAVDFWSNFFKRHGIP